MINDLINVIESSEYFRKLQDGLFQILACVICVCIVGQVIDGYTDSRVSVNSPDEAAEARNLQDLYGIRDRDMAEGISFSVAKAETEEVASVIQDTEITVSVAAIELPNIIEPVMVTEQENISVIEEEVSEKQEMTIEPEVEEVPEEIPEETPEEESEPVITNLNGFLCNEDGIVVGIDQIRIFDGLLVIPFDESVTGIAAGVFDSVLDQIMEVYIPANIVSIEEGAFAGMSEDVFFEVDENNPVYGSDSGVLYLK